MTENRGFPLTKIVLRALICTAPLIAYFPALTSRYGWEDDFLASFWDNHTQYSWIKDVQSGLGRFLLGPILDWLFKLNGREVDQFWRLRLVSLIGALALCFLVLIVVRRSGLGELGSGIVALAVVLSPAVAIQVGWAVCCVYPYASCLACAGGYLALRSFDAGESRRAVCLALGVLFLCASLCLYQPCSGFFLLPAFWSLWRQDRSFAQRRRAFLYLTAVALTVCVAYVALYRLWAVSLLAGTTGVERGSLSTDFAGKAWYLLGVARRCLLFWTDLHGVPNTWKIAWGAGILVAMSLSFLGTAKEAALRITGTFITTGFALSSFALPREDFAPFRCLAALYAIVIYLAVRGITAASESGHLFRGVRRFCAGVVLAATFAYLVVTCRVILLDKFIAPNVYELKVLSEYVRRNFTQVPGSLVYVLPDWCIWALTPEGSTEEFGSISSWNPTEAGPMLQLLFQEQFPADYIKRGPGYLSIETVKTVQNGSSTHIPVIYGKNLLASVVVNGRNMVLKDAGWIHDVDHGWMYRLNKKTGDSGVTYWDTGMKAYWRTSEKQYPYLYRYSDSSWLWYEQGSGNPRLFYNMTAMKWESWP